MNNLRDFAFRSDTFNYRDYLNALLLEHKGGRGPSRPPALLASADNDDQEQRGFKNLLDQTKPIFMVTDSGRRGNHVFFRTRYGSPGGHDLAASTIDATQDVNIVDRLPTRPFRSCLLLPDSDNPDDFGILAVESIGRSCPHRPVIDWIRYWASTTKLNGFPEDIWWKLVAKPLGDDETLNAYLNRAEPQEVRLTRDEVSSDGRSRSVDLKLTAQIRADAGKRAVRKEMRRWIKGGDGGQPDSSDAVSAVAAVLGLEVGGLEFSEVAVQLDDDEFGKRTVSPDDFPDIFTYQISEDLSPSDDTFLEKVRSSVERLQMQHKPHFDWTGLTD